MPKCRISVPAIRVALLVFWVLPTSGQRLYERRKQMLRKLMILIFAGVVFFGIFTSNIVAATFEKLTPKKVPVDQIVPSSPLLPTNDKGFCLIQSDNDDVAYYFADFQAGDGFALYMDPAECGVPDPYPFQITDVHFYLYDPGDYTWPVEIQVNIRDLAGGDKCNGPGNLLCSQIYTIPSDSAYPNLVHLDLDTLCCIYAPFFLEIIYTGETDPPYPSLIMTDENTNPTDTCDAWAWYFFDTQHYYFEWSDFWTPPPPGYPVMRITGYTQQCHPESCWYWKDSTENSPSGMPDFDQNQDEWNAYCGPTAVANCLWWYDAVPEGMSPPELIELLAEYFHTRPGVGTYVDTMQMGLEQYFQEFGQDFEVALQESTFEMPDFHEMEDSLKRSQDIILLIGFWWSPDGVIWYREGGHFVTMAGVCSDSLNIAISDPDRDGAVGGAPGRVKPPEHPQPGDYDATRHNDPTYVSHDMYTSTLDPEYPSPGNPHWEINYPYVHGKYSGLNVPDKFKSMTRPAPKGLQFSATEVEYAVMICPKTSGVEEEEEGIITPKVFELYQSYPNPFNNQTIINYSLLKSCHVTLTIYNILGQKVKTLVDERQKTGPQTMNWDGKDEKGRDLTSGIYFYQLKAGEITQTKRMVLLK
jgi:hypothetical protein